jgi:hypothetical protein
MTLVYIILEFVLNSKLRKLDIWMKSNKLSVNISKTNYIIFCPRQKKINLNLLIQYNNQMITQNQYIKFLARSIYICNKIVKSVGIIYQSRYLLSFATRLILIVLHTYISLSYLLLAGAPVPWRV